MVIMAGKLKSICAALLAVAVTAAFAGCNRDKDDDAPPEEVCEFLGRFPEDVPDSFNNLLNRVPHSASNGLDENGFWIDANATALVDFGSFNWRRIEFPHFVGAVTEDEITERIFTIFEQYEREDFEITDRAVEDGDLVNIDFRGYIDGVPFEDGDTDGNGAYVVAGGDRFIDDFLTQIIGRMPGETFDVNVTFPEHYPQNPDLEDKPARFVTTINYIVVEEDEDVYVKRNFYETYGWSTMEEYRAGLFEMSVREQQGAYLVQLFAPTAGNLTVEIPENLRVTAAENFIRFHQGIAATVGEGQRYANFAEYLTEVGVTEGGIREFVNLGLPRIEQTLRNQLIMQAIAVELNISVTMDDVRAYYDANGGLNTDLNDEIARVGLPSMKQDTMMWMVRSYLIENAVHLEPPGLAD
jgi:trigger factor